MRWRISRGRWKREDWCCGEAVGGGDGVAGVVRGLEAAVRARGRVGGRGEGLRLGAGVGG